MRGAATARNSYCLLLELQALKECRKGRRNETSTCDSVGDQARELRGRLGFCLVVRSRTMPYLLGHSFPGTAAFGPASQPEKLKRLRQLHAGGEWEVRRGGTWRKSTKRPGLGRILSRVKVEARGIEPQENYSRKLRFLNLEAQNPAHALRHRRRVGSTSPRSLRRGRGCPNRSRRRFARWSPVPR